MSAYDAFIENYLKNKQQYPMKMVYQPEKSRCCGQACVAMILGVSLEESIALFGHKKGTKTKDLSKILQSHGFSCGERLIPLQTQELPPLCICKIVRTSKKNGSWHWIIHNHGRFYDPSFGVFIDEDNLKTYYSNWQLTSYLEIKKSDKTLTM